MEGARAFLHRQVVTERTDKNLTTVKAYANIETTCERIPNCDCGEARANGVVFVGKRRAEQRHDAVTLNPVNRPFIAVDRVHHRRKRGAQVPGCFFRIQALNKRR